MYRFSDLTATEIASDLKHYPARRSTCSLIDSISFADHRSLELGVEVTQRVRSAPVTHAAGVDGRSSDHIPTAIILASLPKILEGNQ